MVDKTLLKNLSSDGIITLPMENVYIVGSSCTCTSRASFNLYLVNSF